MIVATRAGAIFILGNAHAPLTLEIVLCLKHMTLVQVITK
jgi:hypothetical protein